MDNQSSAQRAPLYQIAMIPLTSGTVEHSAKKVSIATRELPDHICGQALRIGYTGTDKNDWALYRLKVKANPRLLVITLPGLFILVRGIFQPYQ